LVLRVLPVTCITPPNAHPSKIPLPHLQNSPAWPPPIELKNLAALALQESPNFKRTAKEYGVTRTVLSRRHKGLCRLIQDAREFQRHYRFSRKLRLRTTLTGSEAGIPPTPSTVRVFTFEISRQWPGNHGWLTLWKPHKATLKSTYLYGFDLKRKRVDNQYMIKKYFELVRILIFIQSHAHNINR